MDMSTEQKCFDLGGGCKVKEFFCVKCAYRSSDGMFFWERGGVLSAIMNIAVDKIDAIILKWMMKRSWIGRGCSLVLCWVVMLMLMVMEICWIRYM